MIAQAYFETYGVQTEGLFRISAEKPVLDELVAKFDDGSPVDISSYADSGHTMAGLLKRYFREMPEPLIPFDLYEPFTRAVMEGEMEQRALRIQKIVALLSKPRFAALNALMEILVRVAASKNVNMMTAENLSVVFAPTLFRPPGNDLSRSMTDTPLTTCCVVLMIDFYDRIFPPDESLKKKGRPELFVPQKLDMPPLPPLPGGLAEVKKAGGKRGSVTIDNAQLGSLLAKKSHNSSVDELVALVGRQVWAQNNVDGKWYRAAIEAVSDEAVATVVFVDYGNRQYCARDQITTSDPNVSLSVRPTPSMKPTVPHSMLPTSPVLAAPNAAPAQPQPGVRVEPAARPEAVPRPLPRSQTQVGVLAKSTPSLSIVAPPRPDRASPRQSDLQVSPRGGVAYPQPPNDAPPRGITGSQTSTSARPVAPERDIRRAPDNSSGSSTGARPAPAPRPAVSSASFSSPMSLSGHASPVVSLPSSQTNSPALGRVSAGTGTPQSVAVGSATLYGSPLPLPRHSPMRHDVPSPLPPPVEEEAPPLFPQLPVTVLDVSPRVIDISSRVIDVSPRVIDVSPRVAGGNAEEPVEDSDSYELEQPSDNRNAVPLPMLPPKTESVLSKMKLVASQNGPVDTVSPGETIVRVDANALLSSAPPPTYAEFDDE